MPLDRRGAIQLGILVLILPAQYFITTYFGATNSQKDYNLKRVYERLNYLKTQYLSWDNWEAWCMDLYSKAKSALMTYNSQVCEDDESLAVEVINYRNSKGYFASSTDPRTPRPLNIKYFVGQVVRHKQHNYRGVIIGWDAVAKAPESWMKQSVPADKHYLRHSPAYLILVDTRDRAQQEIVYVIEDNLELLQRTMVIHPKLSEYFDGYDGYRYLPRHRLKAVYPLD